MASSSHQLVFYDFETTGLNPFHEEIIEYAFFNLHTGEKITGIVNPNKRIPEIVVKITKITNEMVQMEEPLEGHGQILHNFLNRPNLIFVAHNGDGFDKFFLKRMIDRLSRPGLWSYKSSWKHFDTIFFSKLVFPQRKSNSLANLCKDFMIEPGTHRAMDDVKALHDVFMIMLRKITNGNEDLMKTMLDEPMKIYNLIY